MSDIEILNIRMPSEIVDWLDSLVKRGIYKSRSEAIRDFCREYIAMATSKQSDGNE